MKNKWNQIVDLYHKHKHDLETKVQDVWESIFSECFGYSKLSGEVERHRNLSIGAQMKAVPDIILRKDNKDVCMVELKRLNMCKEDKYENQLLSYMKQVGCSVGMLICNNIYIYYLNFANHSYINYCINFTHDSVDGCSFVELFSKGNFNSLLIKEFIEKKNNSLNIIKEIHQVLTDEYITDIIKKFLCDCYGQESTEIALQDYLFKVQKKGQGQPSAFVPKKLRVETIGTHTGAPTNDKLGKINALKTLQSMGFVQICDRNTTYASNQLNSNYPSNVAPNRFESDLYFVLDDTINKKCYCFKIPAHTFHINNFEVRKDKGSAKIYINYNDSNFEDNYSGICFKEFLFITFDY